MGLPSEIHPFALGAGEAPKYEIERSLRFNDDDSAYLTRTISSTPTTYTISVWVKRGNIGFVQPIIFSRKVGVSSDGLTFTAADKLLWQNNNATTLVETAGVFRDVTSWYHIVVSHQQSGNVTMYVNGLQVGQTAAGTNRFMSSEAGFVTAIGRYGDSASFPFDGYMAEFHFVDGQALNPTSFGEFDDNGVWRPIKVSGLTYGTNGFYLPFSDNTSTTTLGDDASGNNNDWTLNNFSVTAGAGNDSLEDTPTNNYCTLNPISPQVSTLSNGNLVHTCTVAEMSSATIGVASGQWYAEYTVSDGSQFSLIVSNDPNTRASGTATRIFELRHTGLNGTTYATIDSNTYSSASANDTFGIALDVDAGTCDIYQNGVIKIELSAITLTGPFFFAVDRSLSSPTGATITLNFGQRAFAYTPPTGFQSLCTANLPKPDIVNPGKYMNAVTYAGTGSSQSITGVGFQPDLVWIKGRSGATDHALYDSVRGVERQIESNTTTDETLESTGLTAFGSDGFTIGSLAQLNTSAATYVAWNWKKGVTPGFDIVTYTGNGTARTIAHSLGAVPHFMIVKARTTASTDQGWPVYHRNNTAAPETDYLLLNTTAATADLDTVWNDTAPTSSVFSVGTNALVNTLNDTYVAYLFAEVEGFSKFGSYTGNGSADGPFVWCGFSPRFILTKRTNTTGDWNLHDTARTTINPSSLELFPHLAIAEVSNVRRDILSNGFKIRESGIGTNASGDTYIFAAFAENPFKYSRAR